MLEKLVPVVRADLVKNAAGKRPELADEIKRLSDEKILGLSRSLLLPPLSRALADLADRVPALEKMKQFLETQNGKEDDGKEEVRELIARHLFETYLDAAAEVVLDKARTNFE